MSDNYQNLLKEAAQLYDKHDVGRPASFNVFSVLHKETDEVNLHSRFLHALLDYKKPETETRENLKDFLQHVGVEDFELCDVKVERERYNIDILITNDAGQAIIIENKIEAGDQPKQLQRYSEILSDILEEQGYSDRDIHLLYLTLDDHDPSEDSAGDLDYKTISYRDDLSPWLEHCQKRAYDEPALRETVAQYLHLIRKLTYTDFRGEYMEDLKKFCLDDNNFVPIHDLHKAMSETKNSLQKKLWEEIESELKSKIQDLPSKNRSYNDLRYRLSESTSLEILGDSYGIWFRVVCKDKDKYDQFSKALKDASDKKPYGKVTCWQKVDRYLNLNNLEDFKLLLNDANRQEYAKKAAQGIAEYLKPVWEVLEDLALVNAIKKEEKTEFVSEEQIFEILERVS